MIIVKLIVLFCCFNGFNANPTDFCEICLNHTLCKYKTQGPSASCTSYTSSAKLTSQDIKELVNRINERRNFVAMGYSKILPHAANMKKITQGPSASCTSYTSSAKLTSQDIKELVNRINERRNFVAMGYSKILPHAANMKKITQGPSASCTSYTSSAKLTSQDIKELVNRINERRNFVAMGYSKILPHAANMKKIHWSTELATSAQRWADQCDPAMHPDREDQCRDLENVKVGQNIGSVVGPSPGLSVKGFVEMWFIQVLDYTGSVTYYNKSRDHKTGYLTQLIWANTEFVGCGKVKFYVDERNVMLERLVCNFAPKGNSHGKPVYSIGYPATQCKTGMVPDDHYKGLCGYEADAIYTKLTSQGRPVKSLLRILNLSNDSVKHEIDPLRNNLKQTYVNNNFSKEQRNQKTRHIFTNKTYAAVKRIPQLRKQMIENSFMNISGNNNEYHYQHDRGHSHLYHGHEPPRHNYDTTKTININQDFRRYDYTTEPITSYSNTNLRRFNQYAQCTRRIRPIQDNCALNKCTTTAPDCCPQQTMCPFTCTDISCTQPVEDHTCFTPYIPPLPDPCACTQPTCPPISTNCNYNTNCPCSVPCSTSTCCLTTKCPGPRRQNNDFNDYRRAGTFQYYDMIPNVVVRSGELKIPQENSNQRGMSLVINTDKNKSYKAIYDEKDSDQIHKGVSEYPKFKSQEHDYMYRSFNSDLRKKRQLEGQMPVKPFWQIETFNHHKPPQIKSMRFTTLKHMKNRKSRKNTDSAKWLTSTEPITLRLADYADYQPEHITEKYLSFDELMHLRKISDGFAHYDLRRKGKTTKKAAGGATTKKSAGGATTKKAARIDTTKAATRKNAVKAVKKPADSPEKDKPKAPTTTKATVKTTEYTANTQFERKKYCTRKITCSWTAYTGHGKGGEGEGGEGTGGGGAIYGPIDMGSRTPPGYVDGCSRTSTCTRDYMDRNKIFSTVPPAVSYEDSSESPPEDEDYCERRSLNVQRRHSDTKKATILLLRYLDHTNVPILTTEIDIDPNVNSFNTESVTETFSNTHHCICNEKYARQKREESDYSRVNEDKCDNSGSSFSYSNLYSLILNKILKSNQANKYNRQCPCNNSISSSPIMFLFLLLIFLNTFYL